MMVEKLGRRIRGGVGGLYSSEHMFFPKMSAALERSLRAHGGLCLLNTRATQLQRGESLSMHRPPSRPPQLFHYTRDFLQLHSAVLQYKCPRFDYTESNLRWLDVVTPRRMPRRERVHQREDGNFMPKRITKELLMHSPRYDYMFTHIPRPSIGIELLVF